MSFDGELRGIRKAYGATRANDGVDLLVRAGTVHALVGENGAGKSTAMKTLFGMVRPDHGSVLFGGQDTGAAEGRWGPRDAFDRGIGMVHQHFMLAGQETVQDNLALGAERKRFGLRDRRGERAALEELMRATGLRVPLVRKVSELPVGLQSRCEILKVLYRKATFLILDEPTAVLAPSEIEDFLETLRALKGRGDTILLVTHKLKEVMAVADDVTVLRAGRAVATRRARETSVEELSELMVGRRLHARRSEGAAGATLLRVNAIEMRAGEIIGVAGVEGNGQEEVVATVIAAASANSLPLAVIPADRHREGMIASFSLTENLRLRRAQARKRGLSWFGPATAMEASLLQRYDVRPSDPLASISSLSGGNQQKLVVARELGTMEAPGIVVAAHPTRGVDLGAIEFIHARLLEAAGRGSAVLLISSELDELMALSQRIGALFRGEFARWFTGPRYDEKAIGIAMLAGSRKEP